MMPNDPPRTDRRLKRLLNLPNQLTSLRLLLSVVLFFLIAWKWYVPAFVLFVIAAGTDWLDGYYARKYGEVTRLGRILDPFADKVILCGTFILLAATADLQKVAWGLQPWMAVVIVGAGAAGDGPARLSGAARLRFFRQDVR